MNKSTPNSKSKYLYIGMIFYVLIFFSGLGFIGHIMSAKAAPSSHLIPADTTGTPIDTTTPVPTIPAVTPTPAPTTPAVTPTPAPTTPAAQPTTPPAQPTSPPTRPTKPPVPLPPPPGPVGGTGGTDVTATPSITATTTGTATATTTAIAQPAATTPTSLTQNTTHTPPSGPNPGADAGGPSVLGLSLGIGTPVLLLFGGGLFWLYLRRKRQGPVGLQFSSPTSSSWISSNEMATNNDFSPVLGSFAPNSATPPPFATNPLLSANMGATSVANTLQQATLPPFAELAGPLYTPSDLRPITMNLPQPFSNQAVPNPTSYPPTSDMNPLSFEALNLPQNIAEMMAPQQPPNIAEIMASQQSAAIPISTTAVNVNQDHMPSPIQNSSTPAATIQPPDPANNPVLENVMRQAQLGLFVIPNR